MPGLANDPDWYKKINKNDTLCDVVVATQKCCLTIVDCLLFTLWYIIIIVCSPTCLPGALRFDLLQDVAGFKHTGCLKCGSHVMACDLLLIAMLWFGFVTFGLL